MPTIATIIAVTFMMLSHVRVLPAQVDEHATHVHEQAAPPYEFEVIGGVWLPRLGGTVKFGPSSAASEISFEDDFNLDSTEAIPDVELSLRKDARWELNFSGYDFETDAAGAFAGTANFGGLTLNPGDAFSSSVDMMSVAAEFAWWPSNWKPYTCGLNESTVDLWFAPGVGVRYLDIDQSLSIAGEGELKTGGEWIAPYVTLQLLLRYELPHSFPLGERFEIDAQVGIGPALGGDGGFVAHVRAGMTFFICDNFGLTFGYRVTEFSVEQDDYDFQAGLQGLFFGGTFRF